MEQIYYVVAVVVYSIFIIRFVLSWIGADFDIDADADLDLSDVVSFKGLTHFLMGSSGWLSAKSLATHDVQWWDYLIAFAIGILFVIILYFVYKFLTSLETKPIALYGKNLVGREGTVYLIIEDEGECNKYIITVDNNIGTVEVSAKSVKKYSVGDRVKIFDYENAYYII